MSGTDYRDGPGAAAEVTREDATVVVLGDAMLDVWKWGRCERLCREAPVPVVDIERSSSVAGGAGNTAANVAALGADTRLLALTGDDAPATALAEVLARSGVDTGRIYRAPDRATPVKTRIVADEQILVRFDDVSTGHARLHEVTEMLDRLDDAIIGAEALIVCDYGGPLGDTLREGLLQRREHLPLLIVDTHHPGRWRELHPDIVTPNAGEAAEVLGLAAAAARTPSSGPSCSTAIARRCSTRSAPAPPWSPSTGTAVCCSTATARRTAPGRIRCARASPRAAAIPSSPR
ncbi:bifunctional heptose 7-phosphate kinase/heptose 1-phosphate adenyltransferase [Nocardia cyriacigeorgica]|uniref:bifunctional heptose 7-phosphate kinase/heptose 1-phosphate adenyltransferase n=1 Tax=Nocardia cyriacigeorgica TaxID=135487 RepID=UPI0024538884|nr:PfkB family carbohydrate kinase [Nocardia cyriacigeorgica]